MAEEQKTTIDSLLELINAKGKMDVNAIALELKTAPALVEDWVKILEKGGLVKVVYELGRMYVLPLDGFSAQSLSEDTKLNIQEEAISNETDSNLIKLKDFSESLQQLKSSTTDADTAYAQSLPEIKAKQKTLNDLYKQIQDQNSSIVNLKKNFEETYKSAQTLAAEMNSKLGSLGAGGGVSAIDETLKKAESVFEETKKINSLFADLQKLKEKRYNEINTDLNAAIKQLKSEIEAENSKINEQLKVYLNEIKAVTESLNDQIKFAHKLDDEVKGFKNQKLKITNQLNASLKNFADAYEKNYSKMSMDMEIFDKSAKELTDKIDNVKKIFGESGSVYDTIYNTQKQIADIESRIAADSQALNKIKEEISKLKASQESLTEKNKKTNEIAQKIDNLSTDVDTIEKNINSSTSSINAVTKSVGKPKASGKKKIFKNPMQKPKKED